uniref:UDENN domain-containing protein n=1 Tax=Scophthalmus maximus TaxID=52904 RepID=A0A8D3A6I9_SCOMX
MLALRLEQGRQGGGEVDRLQKGPTAAWQGRQSGRPPSHEQSTNIREKISQWEGRSQQRGCQDVAVKAHPPTVSRTLSADLLRNGCSDEVSRGGLNANANLSNAKRSLGLDFRESPAQAGHGVVGRKSDPLRKGSAEFSTTSPGHKPLAAQIFVSPKVESNTAKSTIKHTFTPNGDQTTDRIFDVEVISTPLPPSADDQDDNMPAGNFYTSRGFWRKLEGDRLLWEKGRESPGEAQPPAKPQRTFQYRGANDNISGHTVRRDRRSPHNKHHSVGSRRVAHPPSFPPPPCPVARADGLSRHKKNRKSFEYEDAARLTAKQGTPGGEARRSGLYHAYSEDSIYEDIVCKLNSTVSYVLKATLWSRLICVCCTTQYINKIETIFDDKRGRKRVKNQGVSVRGIHAHTHTHTHTHCRGSRRSVYIQSTLRRRPGYRTLERDLIQLQQQQLFQIFVVVSLRKGSPGNTYSPEITQQFPKIFEKSSRPSREAEDQLRVIPKFCFPDSLDWKPSAHMPSETFSFVLTGEDGSRWFCYCRKILPSGKGKRLPEVHCIVSKLGCFNLFAKILEEVERRREISPALVYPFMRSVMEAPFPAPGRTVTVKSFLPGSGNEVLTLCRPVDSRLEHVDFDSLLQCLSVGKLLQVFASLLLERRVIFIADKLSVLSRCSHAVLALLYPFTWQHTFVPVLPASMLDISCSPTPFLIGVLAPCLPQLLELPIEEVLIVDLCADKFVVQLGDEDCILPSKLQAALQQILEERAEILGQEDGHGCGGRSLVSEGFVRLFVELVGHYPLHMVESSSGSRELQRDSFRKSHPSRGVRQFLQLFMDTQMFAGFIQDKELRKGGARGLFEVRVVEYLDSYPEPEPSGVNKFLKGLGRCPLRRRLFHFKRVHFDRLTDGSLVLLGNKMKLLQIK